MKMQRLARLCVGAAPLILTGPSRAEFQGIQAKFVANPYGLLVCRIYAVFDRPGEDLMHAVAGTSNAPLTINLIGGEFYQHPLGGDTAPTDADIQASPSLAFDTFVTIGVGSVGEPDGQPADNTILTPGFPVFLGSSVTTTEGGWGVAPTVPQSDPFDLVGTSPGSGRVLLGQFSSKDALHIEGAMLLQYKSNGVTEQREIEFTNDYPRCTGDPSICVDHPCFEASACDGSLCMSFGPPSPDCNGNLVLDSCEINWGTSQDLNGNGVPDECDPPCPWDCADGDGHVGIEDFLAVLGQWGQVDASCDIDGGGVGITDFLALLANWGMCP